MDLIHKSAYPLVPYYGTLIPEEKIYLPSTDNIKMLVLLDIFAVLEKLDKIESGSPTVAINAIHLKSILKRYVI